MRLTLRFSFALVLLALVAACGGAPQPPTVPTNAPPAPEPTEAPTTRTVEHVLGEATITGTPVRAVALEWTYVEDLLALGLQPVGVADVEGYNDWVKTSVPLSPEAKDVGFRGEPSLETMVGLNPDLIIEINYSATAYYDELTAMAPTLVFDPYPADESIDHLEEMRSTLTAIAEATNRQAEGQAALEHMEAKIAEGREQIEAAGLTGEKFILAQAFSWDGGSGVRLFTDNSMSVKIVEQLGLENAWDDGWQQYGFTDVSVETLPDIAGDVHFFYVLQNDDAIFTSATGKPLWDSLAFVKAGNAHHLGGDVWLFGGPLSAELLVDTVVNTLVGAAE